MYLLFSSLLLISALMVISAKNPVHSVLFLILAFCNATGILLLWNVEFLAFILLIVYVGAIAMLFLFVVMMLNIRLVEIYENQMRYLPIGGVIAFLFFIQLYLLGEEIFTRDSLSYTFWDQSYHQPSHIEVLGQVLYTHYGFLFILAGLVLLVAMLGALLLTG